VDSGQVFVCSNCRRAISKKPISACVIRRRAGGYELVPAETVLIVRSDWKGLDYELDNGETWFEYGSLIDFLAEHGDAFIQISRAVAVRISAIAAVQRSTDRSCHQVVLIDGQVWSIAKRRWNYVKERLGTELIRCGQNKARDFSRALPLAVTPRQILCP